MSASTVKVKFTDPLPYRWLAGTDPDRWAAADGHHAPFVVFVAGNPQCRTCNEPARKTPDGWEHGEVGHPPADPR